MSESMKAFDFQDFLKGFRFPDFSGAPLLEAQQKTMTAFLEANRVAFDGYREIFARQMEMMQEAAEELGSLADALDEGETPTDALQKRVGVMRGQFEKGMENMRELAQMTAETNTEAFRTLTDQMRENMSTFMEQSPFSRKTNGTDDE